MLRRFPLELRPAARGLLVAEFVLFYLVAPLVMALALPPSAMFPGLFGLTLLGLVLLHFTEAFQWSELGRGLRTVSLPAVGLFALLTAIVAAVLIAVTAPADALALLRHNPLLLALIVVLYPPLSALPQEIVFRPLFFRRYGGLLPGRRAAVLMNAAVFSLAHLMYWSWIVAAMTFFGGLAFAWAYEIRRNFPMAVILHSVAGWIVFAAGLGIFFYSGNVERPF